MTKRKKWDAAELLDSLIQLRDSIDKQIGRLMGEKDPDEPDVDLKAARVAAHRAYESYAKQEAATPARISER